MILNIEDKHTLVILRALANELRLKILKVCSKEPVIQANLKFMLDQDVSRSAISQHIKILKNAGLIKEDLKTRRIKYVKTTDTVFQLEILSTPVP